MQGCGRSSTVGSVAVGLGGCNGVGRGGGASFGMTTNGSKKAAFNRSMLTLSCLPLISRKKNFAVRLMTR